MPQGVGLDDKEPVAVEVLVGALVAAGFEGGAAGEVAHDRANGIPVGDGAKVGAVLRLAGTENVTDPDCAVCRPEFEPGPELFIGLAVRDHEGRLLKDLLHWPAEEI